MRQIPTSGEYCGECLRVQADLDKCPVYGGHLEAFAQGESMGAWQWRRLPQCLKDKPQVLTEEERMALAGVGWEDMKKEVTL